jgi:hypothetical protein
LLSAPCHIRLTVPARAITAFTHRGLEYLEGILDDRRSELMK